MDSSFHENSKFFGWKRIALLVSFAAAAYGYTLLKKVEEYQHESVHRQHMEHPSKQQPRLNAK